MVVRRTVQKAAEKRAARHGNPAKYKKLKATVQKLVRKDKQTYTDNMCREMETEAKRGNTRSLFKLVKSSTGEVLVEPKAIASRWKEYTEELYYDEDSDQQRSTNVTLEPPPLRSEVEKAMQSVNLKKAPGADGVPIELLRYGGLKVIDEMNKICQEVWKTGKWPEDWGHSTFIPIPKKGDLPKCTNYRTISLVSHASKVISEQK